MQKKTKNRFFKANYVFSDIFSGEYFLIFNNKIFKLNN